jgi:hypothetical protein
MLKEEEVLRNRNPLASSSYIQKKSGGLTLLNLVLLEIVIIMGKRRRWGCRDRKRDFTATVARRSLAAPTADYTGGGERKKTDAS